jgi:hypothetical protein
MARMSRQVVVDVVAGVVSVLQGIGLVARVYARIELVVVMRQVAAVGVVLAGRIPLVKIEGFIDRAFAKDTRKHPSLPEYTLDRIERVRRRLHLLDGSGVSTLFGDDHASESFTI